MTLVKICGLTRKEDVRHAVELGVWACGFVLCRSPRQVTQHLACRLAGEARGALTVGVVTTEAAGRIAQLLLGSGLQAVQLSGGVDGPAVAAVRRAAWRLDLRPLIIAVADTVDAADADLVLFDARTKAAYGGTGCRLDWDALAARPELDRSRLVLAGGLSPANVAEAIPRLWPAAVDVSSGVETDPGIKDRARLEAFFAAVAAADAHALPASVKETTC